MSMTEPGEGLGRYPHDASRRRLPVRSRSARRPWQTVVRAAVLAGVVSGLPAVAWSQARYDAAPVDRADLLTAFGTLPSARAVAAEVASRDATGGDPSTSEATAVDGTPIEAPLPDATTRGMGGTGGTGGAAATLPPLARRSPIFVPQWELGIGVSTLALPDYRGSDRTRYYGLPFPYATWRSERFTADRSGLKAELMDRGRLEIDMSLAASVPVSSRGNAARAGMPSLNPTLEVGPQLVATLWRSSEGSRSLRAQFPLRYVFTVSRDMHDAGLTFNPRLVFDIQNVAGHHGWNLGVVGGPMFGSRRHHDFYYSVDSAYERGDRPVYRASGGFGGFQLTLALSKRFTHHWFGGFIRADWLDGATFEDSPLVRRRQNVAAGVAFSWILSQSDKRVPLAR